jgi:hypothetical protein
MCTYMLVCHWEENEVPQSDLRLLQMAPMSMINEFIYIYHASIT